MGNVRLISVDKQKRYYQILVPMVDLPLLEKQRKAFLEYTAHIDSYKDERAGLENFLNTICDAYIELKESNHVKEE